MPVSEVSTLQSTRDARAVYDRWKAVQRPAYLAPSERDPQPSSVRPTRPDEGER